MNCTSAGIYSPDMNKLYKELELPNKPRLNYLFNQLNKKERTVLKTSTGRWYLLHFLEDQYSSVLNLNKMLYVGIQKELSANGINDLFLPVEFRAVKKKRKTKIPVYGGVKASSYKLLDSEEFIEKCEMEFPRLNVRKIILDLKRWRERYKGTSKVNKKRYDSFVLKALNRESKKVGDGPHIDVNTINW